MTAHGCSRVEGIAELSSRNTADGRGLVLYELAAWWHLLRIIIGSFPYAWKGGHTWTLTGGWAFKAYLPYYRITGFSFELEFADVSLEQLF